MNSTCPKCTSEHYHKHGVFYRSSDSQKIQRYKCVTCGLSFSEACFSDTYCQKKRGLNHEVFKLLNSSVSQRRCAILLKTDRKTVKRKLIYLGNKARSEHQCYLNNLDSQNLENLQLDDLITSHHTKLKPVSVSIIIEKKNRKILNLAVSVIPAFGHLAKPSRKKYGKRVSQLKQKLDELFKEITPNLSSVGTIETDEHKLYPHVIKKYLPDWQHLAYKSEKAAVVGQGELKKKFNDPLFSVNHTLAMLRANINRLFRRTWNTTKDLDRLRDHLWIYVSFHNNILTKTI